MGFIYLLAVLNRCVSYIVKLVVPIFGTRFLKAMRTIRSVLYHE